MENFEAGQSHGQETAPEAPNKPRFWKFAAWFVGIVVIVLAAASLASYVSPEARRDRELQRNYLQYQKGMSEFEAAMRADTYGGKTPQETLDMFVDALKKGDVELASKYFALDTNTKSPDYLTRRKWEEGLKEYKNKGEIDYILQVVFSSKPDLEAAINSDYFVFSARDEKEIVITDIDLHLNKYSNVWKIESL